MRAVFWVTFKGIFRDRVFQGILFFALALLLIPAVSKLSMRQVPELAANLALALISFIQLLLAVFLGGTLLWKDIERRYSYSVLSLPFPRAHYLFGKFLAVALFNLLVAALLGGIAAAVIALVSAEFPPGRPVLWVNLACAIGFDALKYILLTACAFALSTVSTSFFLPIFGAATIFFIGSASQEVHEFIRSPAARDLPPLVRQAADFFYYVIPNFSVFDLKAQAIYAIPLDLNGLALTLAYFLVYTAIIMILAALIFSRREMT